MTPAPNNKWEMPDLSNVNPALLAPIPDSSEYTEMCLNAPNYNFIPFVWDV